VVVNLSPADADGRVRLPWRDLAGRTWGLADQLTEERFTCSGDELANEGLRVTLDGWGYRLLALET
jgi:hypothetical protein